MANESPAITPWQILVEAAKIVPVVKYAIGLVGIAAGIFLIRGFLPGMSPWEMLPLVLGCFFCMAVLIALASSVTSVNSSGLTPGALILWATSFITILAMTFTLTAVATGWPSKWAAMILPAEAIKVNFDNEQDDSIAKDPPSPASPDIQVAPGEIDTSTPRASVPTANDQPYVTSASPFRNSEGSVEDVRAEISDTSSNAMFDHEVTISNSSGQAVLYLRASQPHEDWGEDWLGDEVISDGSEFHRAFGFGDDQCVFDFKIELEDQTEYEKMGVNVCKIYTINVTPSGLLIE